MDKVSGVWIPVPGNHFKLVLQINTDFYQPTTIRCQCRQTHLQAGEYVINIYRTVGLALF